MVQPRWLRPRHWGDSFGSVSAGRRWEQIVALWASLNLALVIFDITYVPLRDFWLQRRLYPLPGSSLVIPLTVLPDITVWVDPIKGIEPHRALPAPLAAARCSAAQPRPQHPPQPVASGRTAALDRADD